MSICGRALGSPVNCFCVSRNETLKVWKLLTETVNFTL